LTMQFDKGLKNLFLLFSIKKNASPCFRKAFIKNFRLGLICRA
jgi:hypothetical protein